MNESLRKLRLVVDAPGFIEPWLNRFYEAAEVILLLHLESDRVSFESIQRRIYRSEIADVSQDEMDRSWKRGVLEKKENNHYKAADFHTRYDIWAMFEGFKDLPVEIRQGLNQWEFEHYCTTHEQALEQVRRNGAPDDIIGTPRYLLLDETLQVLDEAERFYLWPCNCRSMLQGCSKPVYTCLRFENNRGIGFEISREKAKEIVLDANKKGLMQSGEVGRNPDGKVSGAICNCCSDCCFPHLLAKEKGAEKLWPFSRYIAEYTQEKCTFCGLCAKRCPFDAFVFRRKKEGKKACLSLKAHLCRGCGICATGCPTEAIVMNPLMG